MIAGILQARVSSRRLPGKVLERVLGRPLLDLQIERLRDARSLDLLCVATSTDASDDPVAALCAALGVRCFRGPLEDVLERVVLAARHHRADHVVRLTGDCPLTDPEILDRIVEVHLERGADYTSNSVRRTFPDGLDVEVMRASALEAAHREATLPSHRQHVTPFLHQDPRRFRVEQVTHTPDLSRLRWVVDHPEDLEFVRRVYERLYPANPRFRSADVLALLEREPQLRALNAAFDAEEGWRRSLEDDARFLAARKEIP